MKWCSREMTCMIVIDDIVLSYLNKYLLSSCLQWLFFDCINPDSKVWVYAGGYPSFSHPRKDYSGDCLWGHIHSFCVSKSQF